jgi:raffinose/stachyose/melibiose transport system permease protein
MTRSHAPYVLLLPGMVLIGTFLIVPIGYGFWLSLHEFNGIVVGQWTGLSLYRRVITDAGFHEALWHTVVFAAIVVVGKNVFGLALAVLVSLPLRGVRAFRTVLFLPVTLNIIVIGAFWTYFLAASRFGGLLNQALSALGLEGLEHSWLGTPATALLCVSCVEIWRWAGLHMLIFLAGMQAIDQSLYAAAKLDGANAWQRFRHVTLPQLRPIIFVSTLIALMGAFVRSFDVVWVLTRAGFGTQVVVTYLYSEAFKFGHFAQATATGYILLVIIAIFAFTYYFLSNSGEQHD